MEDHELKLYKYLKKLYMYYGGEISPWINYTDGDLFEKEWEDMISDKNGHNTPTYDFYNRNFYQLFDLSSRSSDGKVLFSEETIKILETL